MLLVVVVVVEQRRQICCCAASSVVVTAADVSFYISWRQWRLDWQSTASITVVITRPLSVCLFVCLSRDPSDRWRCSNVQMTRLSLGPSRATSRAHIGYIHTVSANTAARRCIDPRNIIRFSLRQPAGQSTVGNTADWRHSSSP